MKQVIAIDGPSGAGKSTVARLVAEALGFDYLDTGALYRAVGLHLSRRGVQENAPDRDVSDALKTAAIAFTKGRVFLNGEDVSTAIRTHEASHYASVFSARKEVRVHLMDIQRDAAESSDIVAEGRDMTTVVFPDAYRKFYLDASVDERTRRRTLELLSRGFRVDEDQVRLDIIERDVRDTERDIAPLKRAEDAHTIDTTGLSAEEVLKEIIAIIKDDVEKRKSQ